MCYNSPLIVCYVAPQEEESLEAKNARVEELCKPADPEMPENKTCAHRQQKLCLLVLVLVSPSSLGCTDKTVS